MNNVILFGRTGHELQLTSTKSGVNMLRFSLAVKSGKYADWIPCTAWGGRAELLAKYVNKGDQLIINGKLRPHEYTDRDGIKRWDMTVEVKRVTFVANRRDDSDFDQDKAAEDDAGTDIGQKDGEDNSQAEADGGESAT